MPLQRSLDELGTPLADVAFCVVDLETTGGSPKEDSITEIGAVKVCRGEVAGTFHSLVAPGCPVPVFVRMLTGITDELLEDAPPIEAVLPSFLEFARTTVLVAHNARFDISFLNAALRRAGYDPLCNRVLDTAALARKLLAGEVPNRRLETLARHLRCAHQPSHRAFADALATVDVLHALIERVAGFGVTTLEDFAAMSRTRMDNTFEKISMCEHLPRGIGVYRFHGPHGATLYVGKAADVKSRVRSYFYGDERRGIKDMLRETQAITAESHATMLEAEVAEARAISRESPRYNRAGKRSPTWYLRLSLRARVPKATATRNPGHDGSTYLGPVASMKLARSLLDALREVLALHRCSRPESCSGCAFSEMGRCVGTDRRAHRDEIRTAALALTCDPKRLLDRVAARMESLARRGRFEQAAEVRDRGALLERTLRRAVEVRALVDAGEVTLAVGERQLTLRGGVLVNTGGTPMSPPRPEHSSASSFVPAEVHREARVITSWLNRAPDGVRLVAVEGSWALPVGLGAPGRFAARG
jgi:DNA polymerase-3 subunit epsilon